MNRRFSKIRHIQEANQRLEQRLILEQKEQFLDGQVKYLETKGYKVVPKFDLADGEYDLSGMGYVCYILKDGKDTGFAYVTTGGIRGMWDGKKVQVVGGQIPNGEVYKILSKPVTPNK